MYPTELCSPSTVVDIFLNYFRLVYPAHSNIMPLRLNQAEPNPEFLALFREKAFRKPCSLLPPMETSNIFPTLLRWQLYCKKIRSLCILI